MLPARSIAHPTERPEPSPDPERAPQRKRSHGSPFFQHRRRLNPHPLPRPSPHCLNRRYIRKASRTVRGKTYFNYLLVESHLTPKGPRQKVVCSLGDLSPRPKEHWLELARKLENALTGQQDLFASSSPDPGLETLVAKVKTGPRRRRARQDQRALAASVEPGEEKIAVLTGAVRSEQSREAGPVHVGYRFWQRLGIDAILQEAGLSERARQLSCAMTLNRLIHPASDLAMPDWIRSTALPDILGVDFQDLAEDALYRNLDKLHPRRNQIEAALAERERNLFDLDQTVFLCDVTSTYFEGRALTNPKARRGYSRDPRGDCKQVLVGLAVNRDGFPLAHEVMAGNRHDSTTLEEMLAALDQRVGLRSGQTVVVDRGMSGEENLEKILARGLHYLVAAPYSELIAFLVASSIAIVVGIGIAAYIQETYFSLIRRPVGPATTGGFLAALVTFHLVRKVLLTTRGSGTSALTVLAQKGGVYLVKGGSGANTGFIVGQSEVVVIDSKMNSGSSEAVVAEIRKVTPNPVKYIVLTHGDGCHVNGLTGYPMELPIMSHADAKNDMEEAFKDPEVAGMVAYLPSQTVTSSTPMTLGSVHLELLHFGPAHTSGDLVVYLPDQKIAFVGDLLFKGREPLIHRQKGGTSLGLVQNLEQLLALDADTFLPEHGDPLTKADIRTVLVSIEDKQAKVRALVAQERSQAEVRSAMDAPAPPAGRPPGLVDIIYEEVIGKE